MPRDGSGVYSKPFPDVVPGTPVESAVYNGFVNDVTIDLNTPRPIIAGGTGANNATEAMFNLKGEIAAFAVTNFDSQVWYPGSFRAASSATGSPVAGHAFAGQVYLNEPLANPPTNQNVIVEARDLNDTVVPGRTYVRVKTAGVWSNWLQAIPEPLYIATAPPATALDNALWWDSDIGKLFVRYNDGNSVQWVEASPIPSIDYNVVVRKTGDTMTGPLVLPGNAALPLEAVPKQQLDASIAAVTAAAAPLDALAFNGLQLNGDFQIDQAKEGDPYSIPAGNTRVHDGWLVSSASPWACTHQGVVDAPAGMGFSGKITITTGGAPGATDALVLQQNIEGFRSRRLAWGTASAQPLSIGFFAKAVRTGTYSVSVANGAFDRFFAVPFTINASNTWEWKTVTIPGDTSGTWATNYTLGIAIKFAVAAGTSRQITANTWTSTVGVAVNGTINGAAANTDRFQITGLVALPGTQVPTAAQAPNLMRPYDHEHLLCQRYYEKTFPLGAVPGAAGGIGFVGPAYRNVLTTSGSIFDARPFLRTKRIAPTVVVYSSADGAVGVYDVGAGASRPATVDQITDKAFRVSATAISSIWYHYAADARL